MHLKAPMKSGRNAGAGFTLIETIMGMGVVGIVLFSLYGGISLGILAMQNARDDLRATQILIEKMEVIRLCNWSQVTTPGYLPANFTSYYYMTNASNGYGTCFTGTLSVASSTLTANYSNDVKLVTVGLQWQTRGLQRSRQLSTVVSRYGIQRYVCQ
jgi:type II secretory pathway pseudopilin PulG